MMKVLLKMSIQTTWDGGRGDWMPSLSLWEGKLTQDILLLASTQPEDGASSLVRSCHY